jgi:hypothetical protein
LIRTGEHPAQKLMKARILLKAETLTEEVVAWERSRNTKHAKADWQFTTADARIKLKRL